MGLGITLVECGTNGFTRHKQDFCMLFSLSIKVISSKAFDHREEFALT